VTTIWNQHLLTSIANGNITFTAGNLGLTLVYSYAVPTNSSPDNINQLLLSGGFQELVPATGYTRLTRATNTTVTSGLTKVVIGADYALTLTAPTYVAAAVFYIPGTQAGSPTPGCSSPTTCSATWCHQGPSWASPRYPRPSSRS
jgi:hypothetical protein